jgi:ADP-ribose pyrophosphatase YjhB (NUDIX family)
VTTVIEYGHATFCPKPDGPRGQCGSVGAVDPTPSADGDPGGAPTEKQLLRWSEALAGIARTGLGFTESLYEQERFEEVLHVAADIRAAIEGNHDAVDVDGVVHDWLESVGKGVPGYVTPKVAVGAAVGNDRGEILLVQRADSGIWLYPTGWADVGYSAAEVVVKEVQEETGIEVEVVRLIAVLDGLRVGMSRIPLYSLVFQCRPIGGELQAHPLECADVGWFPLDELPFPLAGAERWGDHVFSALRGDPVEVLYDSVRSPVWRGDPERT